MGVTPAERAKAVCERAGGDFREVVEAHMMHGLVFVTPELFIAARCVPSVADISDLWQHWPRAECNAWYIWLGVGDAWAAICMMPFELPLVGWYRAGRNWADCKWVPTALLRRKLNPRRFESALANRLKPCYGQRTNGRLT